MRNRPISGMWMKWHPLFSSRKLMRNSELLGWRVHLFLSSLRSLLLLNVWSQRSWTLMWNRALETCFVIRKIHSQSLQKAQLMNRRLFSTFQGSFKKKLFKSSLWNQNLKMLNEKFLKSSTRWISSNNLRLKILWSILDNFKENQKKIHWLMFHLLFLSLERIRTQLQRMTDW